MRQIRLIDLDPTFLQWGSQDGHDFYLAVGSIADAQGLMFLCPKCFKSNGGRGGTHRIVCWAPSGDVPDDVGSGPCVWHMVGTGFEDLSILVGADPAEILTRDCLWSGSIENGEVN